MTAFDAKELSSACYADVVEKHLKTLDALIPEACAKGLFSVNLLVNDLGLFQKALIVKKLALCGYHCSFRTDRSETAIMSIDVSWGDDLLALLKPCWS